MTREQALAALDAHHEAGRRAGREEGLAVAERIAGWLTRKDGGEVMAEMHWWALAAIAKVRGNAGPQRPEDASPPPETHGEAPEAGKGQGERMAELEAATERAERIYAECGHPFVARLERNKWAGNPCEHRLAADRAQAALSAFRRWPHPAGTRVVVTSFDGTAYQGITETEAYATETGELVVGAGSIPGAPGFGGRHSLDRVRLAEPIVALSGEVARSVSGPAPDHTSETHLDGSVTVRDRSGAVVQWLPAPELPPGEPARAHIDTARGTFTLEPRPPVSGTAYHGDMNHDAATERAWTVGWLRDWHWLTGRFSGEVATAAKALADLIERAAHDPRPERPKGE